MPVFKGWCASEVLWSDIPVEAEDGDACGSEDTKAADVLEMKEVPENDQEELQLLPTKRGQDQ